MSTGLVICSVCKREVHQDAPFKQGEPRGWRHCEDKTPRCAGATSDYPLSAAEIRGRWCGSDDSDHRFTPRITRPVRAGSIGRNEPCFCGSGKKYKRCCLAKA